MNKLDRLINNKTREYSPEGKLEHMVDYFLTRYQKQPKTKKHCQLVSLSVEKVAKAIGEDPKMPYFAGLLHDVGKLKSRAELFDGHNITDEEYEKEVKRHAKVGFLMLKKLHLFIALCVGLHHAMRKNGYGISIDEIPKNWSKARKDLVVKIATIISICDFIDSYDRPTKIKHGSDSNSLEEKLREEYPNEQKIIEVALKLSRKQRKRKEREI